MTHELAHQWFGDSVSPAVWSDVWLNEGHATWYQVVFLLGSPDVAAFTSAIQNLYGNSDLLRAAFGPVAAPRGGDIRSLFNSNVDNGGALTLYALRQLVGPDVFQQIERAWVTRFRDRTASTADFIAVASDVSGRDLTAFLTAWLYGTTTPAMPGHPEWTVTPVP